MLRRFFTRLNPEKNITIVSGLPRSGTSMMMKMLAAGGLEILTDNIRQADPDNPVGYFEYEPVKELKDDKTAWLNQANGKVVKVIASLLPHLPSEYLYKVIFMQRDILEILASQRKMLLSRNKDPNAINDEEMAQIFNRHLKNVFDWMESQTNVSFIQVSYNDLINDPEPHLITINQFFNNVLDIDKMLLVVDPSLYRQRINKSS